MRIYVDEDSCIGCGLCVDQRPEFFEFSDDGLTVKPRIVVIPPEAEEICEAIAGECPATSIFIVIP